MSETSSESSRESFYDSPYIDTPVIEQEPTPQQPGRGSFSGRVGMPTADLGGWDVQPVAQPVAEARQLPAGNGQTAIPGVATEPREGQAGIQIDHQQEVGVQVGQQQQPGDSSTGDVCDVTITPSDDQNLELEQQGIKVVVQQAVRQAVRWAILPAAGGSCSANNGDALGARHPGIIEQIFAEAFSGSQDYPGRPGIEAMSGFSRRYRVAFRADIRRQYAQKMSQDNLSPTNITGQKRSRDDLQDNSSGSAEVNQQAGIREQPGAQTHQQPESGGMTDAALNALANQRPSNASTASRSKKLIESGSIMPERFREGRPPRVYFPLEVSVPQSQLRALTLKAFGVRPSVLAQPTAPGATSKQPAFVTGKPNTSSIQPAAPEASSEQPDLVTGQATTSSVKAGAPEASCKWPCFVDGQPNTSSIRPAAPGVTSEQPGFVTGKPNTSSIQPAAPGASSEQPGLVTEQPNASSIQSAAPGASSEQPGLVTGQATTTLVMPAASALLHGHSEEEQQPELVAMQEAAPELSPEHPGSPAKQLPASYMGLAASERSNGQPGVQAQQHRPVSTRESPVCSLPGPRPKENSPPAAKQDPTVTGMMLSQQNAKLSPEGDSQMPAIASTVHPHPANSIGSVLGLENCFNQLLDLTNAVHPQSAWATNQIQDPDLADIMHPQRAYLPPNLMPEFDGNDPTPLPDVASHMLPLPASGTGQIRSPIPDNAVQAARDHTASQQAPPAGAAQNAPGSAARQPGVNFSQTNGNHSANTGNIQFSAGNPGEKSANQQATSGVIHVTATAATGAHMGPSSSWAATAAIPATQVGTSGTEAGKPGAQAGLGVLARKTCTKSGVTVAQPSANGARAGFLGKQAGSISTHLGESKPGTMGVQRAELSVQAGRIEAQLGKSGEHTDAPTVDMSSLAAIAAVNMGIKKRAESGTWALQVVAAARETLDAPGKTLDLRSRWDDKMEKQNVIIVKILLEPEEDKELGLSSFCGQGGGKHTLALERAMLAIAGAAGAHWVMVESIERGEDARRREDNERIVKKAIRPVAAGSVVVTLVLQFVKEANTLFGSLLQACGEPMLGFEDPLTAGARLAPMLKGNELFSDLRRARVEYFMTTNMHFSELQRHPKLVRVGKEFKRA